MSHIENIPFRISSPTEREPCLKIDRKSPEILTALSGAPMYKKQGLVHIRKAEPGEKITTVLKNGHEETRNVALEDSWIVTNPGGEKYIINLETLQKKYEQTTEDAVYKAIGYIKAIKNPFARPIEIMAHWGKSQYGDAECYFADSCDESGSQAGEPYLLGFEEFTETYKAI